MGIENLDGYVNSKVNGNGVWAEQYGVMEERR